MIVPDTLLTWDTSIRPTSGTLVGGNALSAYNVGIFNVNERGRAILAVPLPGNLTAGYLRFELAANAPVVGFNLVVVPIVAELAKLGDFNDISFNNVDNSAADAWDVLGVLTSGFGTSPGNNVDNDYRAVFALPGATFFAGQSVALADAESGATATHVVNPTSQSLAEVLNRAREAATEQGVDYATVMLVHENEVGGLNSRFVPRGLTQVVGDKPTFGGVLKATYVRPSDLREGGRPSRSARGR